MSYVSTIGPRLHVRLDGTDGASAPTACGWRRSDDDTSTRYQLDPLVAAIEQSLSIDGMRVGPYRVLPVNRQWWYRHLQSGVTPYQADALACAVGKHPSDIWPTWFADALGSEIRTA